MILKKFDNSLYERADLDWIKESYLIVLQMAWDREFYDRFTGKYTYGDVIKKGMSCSGILMYLEYGQHGRDWDSIREISGICTGIFPEGQTS